MADHGGIQLLPETRRHIEIRTPGENRLLTIGVIAIVVMLAAYVGFRIYEQSLTSDLATVDGQLLTLEQTRDKATEQELLTFNQQATLMGTLLKNHVFWSQVFTRLERMLQGQVQLASLSGSVAKQDISFTAHAGSYSDVAHQIASFLADDEITDVTIGGIKAVNTGGVDFTMTVQFAKQLLLKQ